MADNMYMIKITTQAEEQLQEIVKYVASELKAPKAALHLLNEIERSISSLSQFPQRVASSCPEFFSPLKSESKEASP